MLQIERLKLELEDIEQELEGLPFTKPDCKICDFGCGEGYTTLGLMLHLDAVACTGVDKYKTWQLPTLEEAKLQFITPEDSSIDRLSVRIKHLLHNGRFPRFQQDDVLRPNNLPGNLDLAYCKLFLGNIYGGDFNNSPKGIDGFNLAINSIMDCVKQDGILCLVEKHNWTESLEKLEVKLLNCRSIVRNEISETGERSWLPMTMYVHSFRKL